MRLALLIACALACPLAAAASDGVIEINQAMALAGDVTPGDSPGYPVTISRSGSYRLTGNLSNGSKATEFIRITADRVTLDLGGFSLQYCPSICVLGQAVAIAAGVEIADVTVRNGNVSGSGSHCIQLAGNRSHIEGLRLTDCEGFGAMTGDNGWIERTIVDGSFSGFQIAARARVTGSSVTGASATGIRAGANSVIESTMVVAGNGIALSADPFVTTGNRVVYRDCVLNQFGDDIQISVSQQPYFLNAGGNACGADLICP